MRSIAAFFLAFAFFNTEAVLSDVLPPIKKFETINREFSVSKATDNGMGPNGLMAKLKTAPLDDENLRQRMINDYNEIPPLYLYYLAERTFPIDQAEAIEWYWLGYLRARMGAAFCADRTAAQGIQFLPNAAPSVIKHIRENPKEAGEIGLKTLAREDLRDSKASPWWICVHGAKANVNAMRAQLRNRMSKEEREQLGISEEKPATSEDDWLVAEDKIPAIYQKILNGSKTLFERLMQPTEETVERLALSLQPKEILTDKDIKNVYWWRNDQLIMKEFVQAKPGNLLAWDGAALRTMASDVSLSDICVSEGLISYRPRITRPAGKIPKYDPNGPKTLNVKESRTGRAFRSFSEK
ncbi:MAG: hypothetical protein KUG56_05220, partial [Kordiimonadaceae bacterium]|nr:hypothetical protein [Kordiimonadaceae bacterium]